MHSLNEEVNTVTENVLFSKFYFYTLNIFTVIYVTEQKMLECDVRL